MKNIMESQWRRNENSNKMSSAFHENNNNNNESSQITNDFSGGTSLTAIVKPTIRKRKMRKSLDAKKCKFCFLFSEYRLFIYINLFFTYLLTIDFIFCLFILLVVNLIIYYLSTIYFFIIYE